MKPPATAPQTLMPAGRRAPRRLRRAHRDGCDVPHGLHRPALADHDSQLTESVHYMLTPGGTEVFSLAFHDFPPRIRIFEKAPDADERHRCGVATRLLALRARPGLRCAARSAAAPLRRNAANRDAQSALM